MASTLSLAVYFTFDILRVEVCWFDRLLCAPARARDHVALMVFGAAFIVYSASETFSEFSTVCRDKTLHHVTNLLAKTMQALLLIAFALVVVLTIIFFYFIGSSPSDVFGSGIL